MRGFLTTHVVVKRLKKDAIQESYDKWSEEVQNNIKGSRQNTRKDVMQLKKQRKKPRTPCQNTEDAYEKTVIIE